MELCMPLMSAWANSSRSTLIIKPVQMRDHVKVSPPSIFFPPTSFKWLLIALI